MSANQQFKQAPSNARHHARYATMVAAPMPNLSSVGSQNQNISQQQQQTGASQRRVSLKGSVASGTGSGAPATGTNYHHQKNKTINIAQESFNHLGVAVNPQQKNISFRQGHLTMVASQSKQQARGSAQSNNQMSAQPKASNQKQSQRKQGQQQNMSMHTRGRSSGVVMQMATGSIGSGQVLPQQYHHQQHPSMQLTSGSQVSKKQGFSGNANSSKVQIMQQTKLSSAANAKEIQQMLDMQQQQLAQALATQNGSQVTQQQQAANPFRRQKQQAKYQQKYQQQLQMYATQNHGSQPRTGPTTASQGQKATAVLNQQYANYQQHVRSLSNCSGNGQTASPAPGVMDLGLNQQQNMANNSAQMQAMRGNGSVPSNHHVVQHPVGRKAPSSINILNQQKNLSSNFNSAGIPVGVPNIANVNNMGQIAMTHQNLLIQPQILQNLVNSSKEQPEEEKVTEAQILESEEYFESGKIYLTEKMYKDAAKMFTKSLQVNKTNYDALFYRAVTNLDQELPEKAISDLEDLLKICPDYRKTMFIVLSIAYRRVNDYLSAIRALTKAIQRYPGYLEAYIARGQIYSFQKKWEKALLDFQVVLKKQPTNGMGHLGHGDSLKGLGRTQEAIEAYSKVIEVDPSSMSQGLMKRGLLYLENRENELALKDFDKLTEMAEEQDKDFQQTSLSKAYFYKAKALKKMENMGDAVLYFEQVLRLGEDNYLSGSALYEIAKIKIQQKDFYEAHYNLQRSSHLNLRYKKLYNYKMFTEGVIFLMKRKTKTGVKLITQVVERMNCNSNLNDSHAAQQNPPAVGDSVDHISDSAVLPTNDDEKDYIFPLLFIYRAYGYIVLEEYEKGLRDYQKSAQMKKLNTNQYYNMVLCQGLKNLEAEQSPDYEQAISFFTRAAQVQSDKRDPYLLRAMAIVQYTMNKPIKPKTKNQMLKDAKKDLSTALQHSPKDEQVLLLRGILNFALHRFYDAICDFERVIEKTDETSALHYLARGRCYACLSMFKEAITDLSIAINLNKDQIDAYLNRGKCAYLIGDTGLAFMDFQKLIVLEPKNANVHIYAGNLLMTTGSYEDATKAFSNANNIAKSPLALYQRSRCHVALNNMQEALLDLNKVIEISKNDKVAIQDRECLNALMMCSIFKQLGDGEEENVMRQPVEHSTFIKAAQAISKLIANEKNENMAKLIHESSIQHQHSQVIPSAHRTKIDKIRAIRRRKEQDRVQRDNPEAGRKNDLRFRVQQNNDDGDEVDEFEDISELDDREIERLNYKIAKSDSDELDQDSSDDVNSTENGDDMDANYYKENIFNKEDFYLYRAVLQIYGAEYEKAVQDLEQCSSIMHQSKALYPKNQFPDDEIDLDALDSDGYESPTGANQPQDDNLSAGSSQTDLSDVGLCSLNIHEYSFNTALCLVLSKNYKQALAKLDYIVQTIAKKYANQLWLLRGVLNSILGYTQQARKDFARAYKYDKQNARKFLNDGGDVHLTVFPQQQRLCSFFQDIDAKIEGFVSPFGKKQTVGGGRIFLKPSFSFPFIKPPNMIPCVDQALVLDSFKLKKSLVQLKPEAPWIKKCQFGIKFTEDILYTDDDRESTPDDEKEYKKRKQRQQERAMEGAGFIRSHSEKVVLRTNIFAEPDEPAPVDVVEDGPVEDDDQDVDAEVLLTNELRALAKASRPIAAHDGYDDSAVRDSYEDAQVIDDFINETNKQKAQLEWEQLEMQMYREGASSNVSQGHDSRIIARSSAQRESISGQMTKVNAGPSQHKRNKTHGHMGAQRASGIDAILANANMKGEIDIQEEFDMNNDDDGIDDEVMDLANGLKASQDMVEDIDVHDEVDMDDQMVDDFDEQDIVNEISGLGLDDQIDGMEASGSPGDMHDFNKVQNFGNLQNFVKQELAKERQQYM